MLLESDLHLTQPHSKQAETCCGLPVPATSSRLAGQPGAGLQKNLPEAGSQLPGGSWGQEEGKGGLCQSAVARLQGKMQSHTSK